MSFAVNHLTGFGAGGDLSPMVISAISTNGSSTNSSSYTFTAQSIGTASNDRYVIVLTFGLLTGAGSVTSVTIGGNAATELYQVSGSGLQIVSIHGLLVTSGTTADIVVTYSVAAGRCGLSVLNKTGGGALSVVATASDTNADPLTSTINIPYGGAAIAGVYNHQTSSGSYTWTGLTEAHDFIVETRCCSSAYSATPQSGLSVSADHSSTTLSTQLAIAILGQ